MDHTQKTADDRTGERRRKTKTDKISLLSVRVCARGIFYAGQPAVLFTGENRRDQAVQTVMSGRTEDKAGKKVHPFLRHRKTAAQKPRSMITKETMKTS